MAADVAVLVTRCAIPEVQPLEDTSIIRQRRAGRGRFHKLQAGRLQARRTIHERLSPVATSRLDAERRRPIRPTKIARMKRAIPVTGSSR